MAKLFPAGRAATARRAWEFRDLQGGMQKILTETGSNPASLAANTFANGAFADSDRDVSPYLNNWAAIQ
jgi:hypothetical protein